MESLEVKSQVTSISESVYSRKTKTFELPIIPSERGTFKEFLDWIKQTSGVVYKACEINDEVVVVICDTSTVRNVLDQHCGAGCGTDSVISVTTAIQDTTPTERCNITGCEIQNTMTPTQSAILVQLEKGVVIPSKLKNDKPLRASLKSLGVSRNTVIDIFKRNPNATLPDVLKDIFTKNGTWESTRNMYNIDNYQDLRRKRAELSVALRKQARDEQLLKRRALSPEAGEEVIENEKTYTPAEIVQGLHTDDLVKMTTYARAARRMLSREQNPPISPMVSAGVIKPLVDALDRDECADLQFEAAWAITNIASGTHEHTMAVVDGGAIPKLVTLLARGGVVGEQSAWALGNIAGDGPQTRDAVLAQGALPVLLPLCTLSTPAGQLRTAVWTYSNFCRNKNPLVKFDSVAPALPYISDLLGITDQDVLADACWALSYLTDGPNERIEAVQVTSLLLPRLVSLLDHKSPAVRTPALRAVGNMLTGSDEQTDRCLDAGCLDHIITLLRCGKTSLMKEAAWAVSNILAGTQAQIQRAIDSDVLQHLLHVLASEDIKCQKEAAWAITNLCLGGTPEQLDALISAGFLEPYCQLLSAPDHRAISVVLDGLTNLLQAAVKYGQVDALCLKLEEIGALDQIEALQQHENEQIYKKVLHILDNYFAEQEDPNAEPTQTQEEYKFGISAKPNINF